MGMREFATAAMGKVRRKGPKGAPPPPDEGGSAPRRAALDAALLQIECSFGSGSVMRMGDLAAANKNVAVIPTGSLALDAALGVGGLPKGRVVEIFGPEASGKTTLALHVVAEAQKQGGTCVFIDAEHALDASFAEAIGVHTADLLIAQPDSGEQALAVADTLIRSGSVDVVVVDSVAALVPKAELAGDMGDAHMALQARLMSQALRKLTHSLAKSDTLLIFINQIRNKLSTFGGFGGPQEVTSGGNALKFYSSVRLNIRRIAYLKKGEEVVGSTVRVKIAKNKVAPPFRAAEFDIEFGRGISQEGELLDIGVREGLLHKSGAWYSYKGENFAQGRDKGKLHLRDNPAFAAELTAAVRERLQSALLERRDSTSGAESVEDESVEEDELEKDEYDHAEAVG